MSEERKEIEPIILSVEVAHAFNTYKKMCDSLYAEEEDAVSKALVLVSDNLNVDILSGLNQNAPDNEFAELCSEILIDEFDFQSGVYGNTCDYTEIKGVISRGLVERWGSLEDRDEDVETITMMACSSMHQMKLMELKTGEGDKQEGIDYKTRRYKMPQRNVKNKTH